MTSYRLKDSATSLPDHGSDQGGNRPADRGRDRLHLKPLLRPRIILPVLFALVVLLLSWSQLRGPLPPGYRVDGQIVSDRQGSR